MTERFNFFCHHSTPCSESEYLIGRGLVRGVGIAVHDGEIPGAVSQRLRPAVARQAEVFVGRAEVRAGVGPGVHSANVGGEVGQGQRALQIEVHVAVGAETFKDGLHGVARHVE